MAQSIAAPASTELNPKTIERERERVNAQLAALKQNERQTRPIARETTKDRVEEPPRKTVSVEPIGEAFPQIDYSATDMPTESVEKSSGDRHQAAPMETAQPSVKSVDTGPSGESDSRDRSQEEPATVVAEPVATVVADDSSADSEPSFGRKKVRKGEKFKGGSAKSESSSSKSVESEPSGEASDGEG